jgi:cytochrome o ubiquinol oxidase subunit II
MTKKSQTMHRRYKIALAVCLLAGFIVLAVWYLHTTNIAVLNPKGPIARQERNLIYIALALSLIVVIPVFALTYGFAWHYREGNKKAKYSPDLAGNHIAETIWWLVPSLIILVLAVITWHSSHTLDPYRPISSSVTPLTIEVVSLDWKWLFIYPQQNIASVNYFEFPKNTPLDFDITSDSVMNSFWIPQLGGQIYSMPGMSTQLHLLASSYGSFNGSSANISGEGFAGMTFVAKSTTPAAFNAWVASAQSDDNPLTVSQYNALAEPSQNNSPFFYSSVASNLYLSIINKYSGLGNNMSGMGSSAASQTTSGSMQGMYTP